ncbi:hypothetical protein [Pseudomonas piscis]|uniref:hypothetical protein n=1 Tax=Pseudomonas piscis TaxID=2614538 RepID=UPI0021D599E6|nr:hypothetical protein [Pseudomonas piscis]MCU7649456.1 hypothetical protein [Pseudomonas piscis]
MKYFNNPHTREVHAYDDDAPQHFIDEWLVLMSDTEVQAYIASASASLPTQENDERRWRDEELFSVIWLRERHRDQLEIETPTTLTSDQFKELLTHIQVLRNWPQSPDFPQIEHRPVPPPWLAEQIR